MPGMIDVLMEQLSGQDLGGLLGAAGGQVDRAKADKALGSGLGAILGGLAKNASKADGADAIVGALQRDHDGSVLDHLGGLLGSSDHTDGSKILGHVFGDKRGQVEQQIAKDSGLDAGAIAELLPMLAPVVMGFLGKKTREEGLTGSSLASLLSQETATAGRKLPDLGGLTKLLDRDGDGDVMDDLGGLVEKAKGLFGKVRS